MRLFAFSFTFLSIADKFNDAAFAARTTLELLLDFDLGRLGRVKLGSIEYGLLPVQPQGGASSEQAVELDILLVRFVFW